MDSECVVTSEWNRLRICYMYSIEEFESERRRRGRKRESIGGEGRVRERRRDGETWKITPSTRWNVST